MNGQRFQAPKDFQGDGLYIGGGFFQVVDGVLELPADGNYGDLTRAAGFTALPPTLPPTAGVLASPATDLPDADPDLAS